MATAANSPKKQRGRPFKKGQSGNPAGRPQGSRNRVSLAVDELLEGQAEALTQKAIDSALEGDSTALRLCLERICPVRRERPISVSLPAIVTAADTVKAVGAAIAAVASGEITPSEGAALAGMIEAQRRAIETMELEERIARLEKGTE